MKIKTNWLRATVAVAIIGASVTIPLAASAARPADAPAVSSHVVGAFADDALGNNSGGWILYNDGAVIAFNGAPYYGGGASLRATNFVGLVPDYVDNGYWLITSTGKYVSDGTTCSDEKLVGPKAPPTYNVVGGIDLNGAVNEGFTMVTQGRRLYNFTCEFVDGTRR